MIFSYLLNMESHPSWVCGLKPPASATCSQGSERGRRASLIERKMTVEWQLPEGSLGILDTLLV